jgi:hypothetical protein
LFLQEFFSDLTKAMARIHFSLMSLRAIADLSYRSIDSQRWLFYCSSQTFARDRRFFRQTVLVESLSKYATDAACAASNEDGVVREIHQHFSYKDSEVFGSVKVPPRFIGSIAFIVFPRCLGSVARFFDRVHRYQFQRDR